MTSSLEYIRAGKLRALAVTTATPKMKARLADLAGAVLASSPADFRKLIADETEKWGRVVKFSGARPD
jgi:tripartite-type tricarboxylate transporter receptor subunit TctC